MILRELMCVNLSSMRPRQSDLDCFGRAANGDDLSSQLHYKYQTQGYSTRGQTSVGIM